MRNRTELLIDQSREPASVTKTDFYRRPLQTLLARQLSLLYSPFRGPHSHPISSPITRPRVLLQSPSRHFLTAPLSLPSAPFAAARRPLWLIADSLRRYLVEEVVRSHGSAECPALCIYDRSIVLIGSGFCVPQVSFYFLLCSFRFRRVEFPIEA